LCFHFRNHGVDDFGLAAIKRGAIKTDTDFRCAFAPVAVLLTPGLEFVPSRERLTAFCIRIVVTKFQTALRRRQSETFDTRMAQGWFQETELVLTSTGLTVAHRLFVPLGALLEEVFLRLHANADSQHSAVLADVADEVGG